MAFQFLKGYCALSNSKGFRWKLFIFPLVRLNNWMGKGVSSQMWSGHLEEAMLSELGLLLRWLPAVDGKWPAWAETGSVCWVRKISREGKWTTLPTFLRLETPWAWAWWLQSRNTTKDRRLSDWASNTKLYQLESVWAHLGTGAPASVFWAIFSIQDSSQLSSRCTRFNLLMGHIECPCWFQEIASILSFIMEVNSQRWDQSI